MHGGQSGEREPGSEPSSLYGKDEAPSASTYTLLTDDGSRPIGHSRSATMPVGSTASFRSAASSTGSLLRRASHTALQVSRQASVRMLEAGKVVADKSVEQAKKPISWFFIGCVAGAYVFGFLSGGASALALPHDGSDFVCHNGESNVDLDTACARIREYEGLAGARRRRRGLTSVPTAYSCLPHYRIPVTGTDGRVTFPYHATSDMMQPEIGKHTLAIVVIHGAMRDADTYFCMMRSLKFEQKDRDPARILVVTPDFNYQDDTGVAAGVQPGDAYWNHSKPWGDWRAGAHSDPASGHGQTVSSFQVLDTFLSLLSDPIRFPNLDKITMVGHSAGGQSVQRYAFSTLLPPTLRPGLTIRYVVANPSSYAYLDPRRPKYTCGQCDCNDNECNCRERGKDRQVGEGCPAAQAAPNAVDLPFEVPPKGFDLANPEGFVCGHRLYNHWPCTPIWASNSRLADARARLRRSRVRAPNVGTDGVEALGYYAAQQPLNISLLRFPRRDVIYLVGQNDTCNDGLPECNSDCWQRDNSCFRNDMDTRCPAMLEGPWRRLRGHLYMRYLRSFYGRDVHHLDEVPGVGHNATGMFLHPIGLSHIFRLGSHPLGEGVGGPTLKHGG